MLSTQQQNAGSSDIRTQALVLQSYSRALLEGRLSSHLKRDVRVEIGVLTLGTFGDFSDRVDGPSSLCSYDLGGRYSGVLEINQSLSFSIVDLLMGGRGHPPVETRSLSALEQNLLGNIFEAFAEDLQRAWYQLVPETWVVGQEAQFTYSLDGFFPQEKMIIAQWEVEIEELAQGSIQLGIPLAGAMAGARRTVQAYAEAENPLDSPLSDILALMLQVVLPPTNVTIERMLSIEQGDILEFGDWEVASDEDGVEVVVCVEGAAKYSGRMGVSGTKKAVEIGDYLEEDTVAGLNEFE
jgi:flagellar motor switch protein FliM